MPKSYQELLWIHFDYVSILTHSPKPLEVLVKYHRKKKRIWVRY